MIEFSIQFEDGRRQTRRCASPVTIGRAPDCELQISHWRVARRHLHVRVIAGQLHLEDLGSLSGSKVNGQRVWQYGPVKPTDALIVGPCLVSMRVAADSQDPNPLCAVVPVPDLGEAAPGQSGAVTRIDQRPCADSPGAHGTGPADAERAIRQELHAALLKAIDLRRRDVAACTDDMLRAEAERCVGELLTRDSRVVSDADRARLLRLVVDEAVGLGVLDPLLADPAVTEIMVNRYDDIFVEREGKLARHALHFSCDAAVRGVIERIVFPLGRRIDDASPMVDARLQDGSRLNAVIPPVAIGGACLTIRKFPSRRLTMADLVGSGAIDGPVGEFLRLCVESRRNVLVSGGTGTGKTTLLNVLASCIPHDQRIVTIEDSAEMRIDHPHVVALEARPENAEGQGLITIRQLVRNALRMRPDRIVVGEVRGPEAVDMLAAMNTGHEGSLATLHANSPRDALARVETMILMAGLGLPVAAIREQVAATVHIIVQQGRLACGRRVVSSIAEVTGIESGTVQLQPLVCFDAASGRFHGSGLPASFLVNGPAAPPASISEWFSP